MDIKPTILQYIGVGILAILIFLPINIVSIGLRIAGTLQCNRQSFKQLKYEQNIAKKNGNFLPMKYRYGDWLSMREIEEE